MAFPAYTACCSWGQIDICTHLRSSVGLESRKQAQARGELADSGRLQELLGRNRQGAEPRIALVCRQAVSRVGRRLLHQQLQEVEPGPVCP